MGRSCYCCEKCYKKIVVIAIYDESDPVYCSSSSVSYSTHLQEWNNLIDYRKLCNQNILAGLMVPSPNGCIQPPSSSLPKDTDNDQWFLQRYPLAQPRLSSDQIFNFFNSVVSRANDTNFIPELLIFVLDNSGSISISQYAEQLEDAKQRIKNIYPNLIILDDVSSSGEQWIQDSRLAIIDKLCLCECDANCFRSLFDIERPGESFYSFPQEAKDHAVNKVTIKLNGFKDWSYSGSYSGTFVSSVGNTVGTYGNLAFGDASVKFDINISNLEIFNRDYVFNKTNAACKPCCDLSFPTVKVDRYPCIFSIQEEYLGDVDISFRLELYNINGTIYAGNSPDKTLLGVCYNEGRYAGGEVTPSPRSCKEAINPLGRSGVLSKGNINSDSLGSIIISYKFAVFLQYKDTLQHLITRCRQPLATRSGPYPLAFTWILKETSYQTSGVYDNLGLIKTGQDITCNCIPEVCQGQNPRNYVCAFTNCERIVTNKYSNCRSIFSNQFIAPLPGANFFSDTQQNFISDIDLDLRVTCYSVSPIKHSNIKIRSPFDYFNSSLPYICFLDLNGPLGCSQDLNEGFVMEIAPFLSDLEWNDATKTMNGKIYSCNPEYRASDIRVFFSKGLHIPVGEFVNQNYFSKIAACFLEFNSECNNDTNTGFLVPEFWKFSGGRAGQVILSYVMNRYRGSDTGDNCSGYTNDKTAVLEVNENFQFKNLFTLVPSPLYGSWSDKIPQYSFVTDPKFTPYITSNNFSHLFGTDGWSDLDPIVNGVRVNENSFKYISPYFILSEPLSIGGEIFYE